MNTRLSALDGIAEILIVEDDAGDAFLAQEYIRDQSDDSVRTTHASSLREALEVVSGSTSCVLLDLNLPDAEGMAALEAILDVAPSVPVVVLTGQQGRVAGVAALNAGAQDYLEKNELSSSTLWRSIRFAVERRQSAERDLVLLEAALRRDENSRLTRGLLPTPQLRSGDLAWASKYAPASDQTLLGGDFIDAVELTDGSVRVVIGDVSGHGPEEAALGAALRIGWRALVLAGADQRNTLAHLDELFIAERNSSTLFTSLCDLHIDRSRSSVMVLSAGHEPPLLIGASGTSQLAIDPGPVIGLGLGVGTPQVIALPARWCLLLFTDGVFEGRCRTGGRLGVPGFIEIAAAHLVPRPDHHALTEVLDHVEREHGGALPDDVAMFLLECSGPPRSPVAPSDPAPSESW